VNAFIDFETNDHHWDFTLTGRNLANKFYFTTLTPVGSGIKSGAYLGTLLLEGAQNPPRTVFFKVSYRY
jgi:iron complex outermembrane receptor protein